MSFAVDSGDLLWVVGLECSGTHYMCALLNAFGMRAVTHSFPYGVMTDAYWPAAPADARAAVIMVRDPHVRLLSLARAGYAVGRDAPFNDPAEAKARLLAATEHLPRVFVSLETPGEYRSRYLWSALQPLGITGQLGELAIPFIDPNRRYITGSNA